jgi:hypothetical protein
VSGVSKVGTLDHLSGVQLCGEIEPVICSQSGQMPKVTLLIDQADDGVAHLSCGGVVCGDV